MDTERYTAAQEVVGARPPDELARRLFALGVEAVTIYSSMVTVTASATRWPELRAKVTEAIENLFIHYAADSITQDAATKG